MLVRFRRSIREKAPQIVILFLFILFMLAYLSPRIFVTIPAGHGAVLFRRLMGGTVVDHPYSEGLRLFFPWDTVTTYSLREQVIKLEMSALTSDGLNLQVTVTVRYQPKARLLGTLHKEHGPDYVRTFLTPEIESSTRHVIGASKPSELYSTSRNLIERKINRALKHELRQFEHFHERYWPHPTPDMMYEGEVANSFDDDANVRIMLKYLYEVQEEGSELTNRVKKDGFIHLFTDLEQGGRVYEQARLYLRRDLKRITEEIEKVKRDLSMDAVHKDVKQATRNTATLDSLNATYHELARIQNELLKEFREGDKQFDGLKEAYDYFFALIEVKDVLISDIVLPDKVKEAIESKLEQEQVAQEFDFRLEREIKEAERKRIEAKGIRDFQDMVAAGIEDGLLRWKAIEATLELARSPNAKMVIIGAGEGGLPIILGNQGWADPRPTVTDTESRVQPSTTGTASGGASKE